MKSIFGASWKNKVGGICTFLTLFFGEIYHNFDDDPKTTTTNYNVIIAAATLLWQALNTRDDKVSSEQAGAGVIPPS